MKYAIIIEENGAFYALLKTNVSDRLSAVAHLCREHMATIMPNVKVSMTEEPSLVLDLENHPKKDEIIKRLLATEFPLPGNTQVIDGEFSHVN